MPDTQLAPHASPLITFTRAWDARTFVVRASLSTDERASFQTVLDRLAALGTIVLARADNLPQAATCYDGAVEKLRGALGALAVDAAVAAAAWPASPFVAPQAVVPLWEFEPVGDSADILVADGMLLGLPFMVEALRVDEDGKPAPACRRRWETGLANESDLGIVDIPGGSGGYAVRAVLRAA